MIDRILHIIDKFIDKTSSGRWILTIIAGIILIKLAWLTPVNEKIYDLVKDIVLFYFLVKREDGKTNGTTTPTNGGSNV